jgi:hypothetical protein
MLNVGRIVRKQKVIQPPPSEISTRKPAYLEQSLRSPQARLSVLTPMGELIASGLRVIRSLTCASGGS